MDINTQITNRIYCTGFCKDTHYTQNLYEYWVKNIKDPDILFRLKMKGFYQKKYKWTDKQTDTAIADLLESSRGYTINGKEYMFDWGVGQNRVVKTDHSLYKMHLPELDHKRPKALFEDNDPLRDDPSNFQVLCKRLNEAKNDTSTDEQWLAILRMVLDNIEDKDAAREMLSN